MNPGESSGNKAIVLFDGACAFCRKSVSILKRLDWLKRLAYQDARDVEHLPRTAEPLEPQRLLQEMHVVPRNRKRTFAGFRAFRWMAGRLPALWLVWPMLFLPGIPWLGQRVYRWVAKNRYNLVPCRDGVCAVPPPTPSAKATEQTVSGSTKGV